MNADKLATTSARHTLKVSIITFTVIWFLSDFLYGLANIDNPGEPSTPSGSDWANIFIILIVLLTYTRYVMVYRKAIKVSGRMSANNTTAKLRAFTVFQYSLVVFALLWIFMVFHDQLFHSGIAANWIWSGLLERANLFLAISAAFAYLVYVYRKPT